MHHAGVGCSAATASASWEKPSRRRSSSKRVCAAPDGTSPVSRGVRRSGTQLAAAHPREQIDPVDKLPCKEPFLTVRHQFAEPDEVGMPDVGEGPETHP